MSRNSSGIDRARARERLALAEDERRLQRLRDGGTTAPLSFADNAGLTSSSPVLRVLVDWLQRLR